MPRRKKTETTPETVVEQPVIEKKKPGRKLRKTNYKKSIGKIKKH